MIPALKTSIEDLYR